MVHCFGRDRTSHRVTNYDNRAVWIPIVNEGQNLNCVIYESGLRHVGLIFASMVSMAAPVKADDRVLWF